MKILEWTIRIIAGILLIPIIICLPGFFLLQIADEIETTRLIKSRWKK